ncbi:MAG: hypothetical protein LBB45_01695 [Methanobrevibacter sp.]|jgi:hypothetical protein|nr:hypothetical protein [Candidatus Methanovirga basalitermitum]
MPGKAINVLNKDLLYNDRGMSVYVQNSISPMLNLINKIPKTVTQDGRFQTVKEMPDIRKLKITDDLSMTETSDYPQIEGFEVKWRNGSIEEKGFQYVYSKRKADTEIEQIQSDINTYLQLLAVETDMSMTQTLIDNAQSINVTLTDDPFRKNPLLFFSQLKTYYQRNLIGTYLPDVFVFNANRFQELDGSIASADAGIWNWATGNKNVVVPDYVLGLNNILEDNSLDYLAFKASADFARLVIRSESFTNSISGVNIQNAGLQDTFGANVQLPYTYAYGWEKDDLKEERGLNVRLGIGLQILNPLYLCKGTITDPTSTPAMLSSDDDSTTTKSSSSKKIRGEGL